MKIHILSDIHLEFGKWYRTTDINAIEADVTILAGDIGIGLSGLEWALTFHRPVIYVLGNHEFYGQRPMETLLRKAQAKVQGTHVHLLDNESVVIEGVRFLGATLWTDYGLFGLGRQDIMLEHAQKEMNDFQQIFVSKRRALRYDEVHGRLSHIGDRFTAHKALALHQERRAFLERELEKGQAEPAQKTVVVTHHAPSTKSLRDGQPTYWLDAAYASRLDDLVERADLWVHGHTPVPLDYRIGRGRVVSNPRGYMGIDEVRGFKPDLMVEV